MFLLRQKSKMFHLGLDIDWDFMGILESDSDPAYCMEDSG